MKLDFLFDMTGGGKYPHADPVHLVRLSDFSQEELVHFAKAIDEKLIARRQSFQVDQLDFVQPQNCSLRFELSLMDDGMDLPEDHWTFVCRLAYTTYVNMLDIITKVGDGYNWLYDPGPDRVDLLLSDGGSW